MQQLVRLFSLVAGLTASCAVLGNTSPGEPAPAFLANDATGESHTLSRYIGEWLVLEWFDPGCEAVQQRYDSGNLPRLQERYREEGVRWLTVISSKPGPENTVEAEEAQALKEEYGLSSEAPILLDETSVVARAYGVDKVPYVVVIDPKGTLVYRGALDDGSDSEDSEGGYLDAVLEAALDDEPLEHSARAANGCELNLDP